MQPNETLTAQLFRLEMYLFDPAVRRNITALLNLLAPGFREFGSSGRTFTRDQVAAELATESSRNITLSDFCCNPIAPTVALVTYRSTTEHPAAPSTRALRSSIWIFRESSWQMIFHHGTRATSPDAPPQ